MKLIENFNMNYPILQVFRYDQNHNRLKPELFSRDIKPCSLGPELWTY